MGTRFYGEAHRGPLGGKASPEGLGGGAQPTLVHDLTVLLILKAQVGVLASEIQSVRHPWSLFATIHSGPILL